MQAPLKIDEITTSEFPFEVEVVAEELTIPWAIAISDEGVIYFTEKIGNVRKIENGVLDPQPLITLRAPFAVSGEGGLMGIALDPDFAQNHYIYIMHTYEAGNQVFNRVVRLVEENNTARIDQVLLDRIPGGSVHDGGRIKIGPDQKLYIATGDGGNKDLVQSQRSMAGKILRINLDGSIPDDNPFMNSPVYALGFRNPQGLAWNTNNTFYASEHGETAHDEINIILPGGNYGWPVVQGNETLAGRNFQQPLIESGEETWAPAGIAFLSQGPWQGNLLVATLRGQQLLSMALNEEGTEVTGINSWLQNEYGRLRDVVQAPDGSIYIATSNQDGRGTPAATDDRILRLVPTS